MTGERVGEKVRSDGALLAYARRLWASPGYQAWRAHMRSDVAEVLDAPADETD